VTRDIDILTSPGLKHLRDRWWDAAFDGFVIDTLQPRPGDWVLEVGAGAGLADLTLRLLQANAAAARAAADAGVGSATGDPDERARGVRYIGIDRRGERLAQARRAARDRGLAIDLAEAEAAALPFRNGACASALCVGVLQHAGDPRAPLRELARVTRVHGRVLLLEPDNSARYFFSPLDSGMRAYALSQEFFRAQADAQADAPDLAVGAHLPALCRECGIDPITVRVFPVSNTRLGAPVPTLWQSRRATIARLVGETSRVAMRSIGEEWMRAVEQYAADAEQQGPAFLEIQHTMLIATVGHVRAS
jgi:ubiquinone/menaquinone biosynthesis C-methylase UbiE